LLDPDRDVVIAEVGTAITQAGARSRSCVMLIHEPPALDASAVLAAWAAAQQLRQHAVVVVAAGRDVQRAALRVGAAAYLDPRTLDRGSLRQTIEDVFDRSVIRAREQADENVKRFRELADALPAYVSYLDAAQCYSFVNQTTVQRFGPAADVCGRTAADVLGPTNYQEVQPQLEAALRGQQSRVEHHLLTPSGDSLELDAAYVPDRRADGSIVGCLVMAVDVTERRHAEQTLRESEERLRMAQDASGLGIYEVDFRANACNWDQRERELWGFAPDEQLTGQRVMSCIHPDDRAAVELALAAATDPDGDGIFRIEHRIVRRCDGETRWIAASGRTTFDGREPVRMVGTMKDITKRKQAEDALRDSKEQLRESDRRKDEFLAMLGHELRNPLAAIRSATELLELYVSDDPRLHRVRDVLDRQSNHMVRLIDGLLEVSRIARGKVHLECKTLDLRDVLADVLHGRSEQLAGSGLTVHQQLPDQPLWVWGDEVRLAQIFDNLLGNAIKFTTAPGTISLVARRCDEWLVVSLKDSGVGIRPEMLESIFEPFKQDTQAIARATGGLGIGLALVRGLVELHHGTVVARSEGPGRGAEFEVRLPVALATVRMINRASA
jgi:two-component system CheB/CheR fusion protein